MSEEAVAVGGVDVLNGSTDNATGVGVGVAEVENRGAGERVRCGGGNAEEEEEMGEGRHGRWWKGSRVKEKKKWV